MRLFWSILEPIDDFVPIFVLKSGNTTHNNAQSYKKFSYDS